MGAIKQEEISVAKLHKLISIQGACDLGKVINASRLGSSDQIANDLVQEIELNFKAIESTQNEITTEAQSAADNQNNQINSVTLTEESLHRIACLLTIIDSLDQNDNARKPIIDYAL